MAGRGGRRRRGNKSRMLASRIDTEQLSRDLDTAAAMCQSYDFLDAMNLMHKVESKLLKTSNTELLGRCALMQAEIYICMGDHESALRCLLKCQFSGLAGRLISRIALSSCSTRACNDISLLVVDLLASCISQDSSDVDDGASESRLLMLDCLCRLGNVAAIRDYVDTTSVSMLQADRRNARYLHRLLCNIRPMLEVIQSLPREWLHLSKRQRIDCAPYITMFRQGSMEPQTSGCTDAVRRMATCVQYAFSGGRILRVGNRSLFLCLLEFVLLINDMDKYGEDMNECLVRLDFQAPAVPSDSVDVSSDIVTLVKRRAKRKVKGRISSAAISNVESSTSSAVEHPVKVPGCLATSYLSLHRRGISLCKDFFSFSTDHIVLRELRDMLVQKQQMWSMVDLGLTFLEVISRYQHLLMPHYDKYTIYICYILYFLCENMKENQNSSVSSGRIFLRDFAKEASLLMGSESQNTRIRQLLRRSGVVILSMILNTMSCTPAVLRDICSPLSINDPQEFLDYMFRQVNSLLLFECARSTPMSTENVILRARVLYVMAKHIMWKHFAKRSVVTARSMHHFVLVRDIARCLHSLLVLAHSMVLSALSRNIHLRLSVRHAASRVNFHSSLTVGSFSLGVSCIERRYLSLLNELRKGRLHS